jgi:hypothetical protein
MGWRRFGSMKRGHYLSLFSLLKMSSPFHLGCFYRVKYYTKASGNCQAKIKRKLVVFEEKTGKFFKFKQGFESLKTKG